MAYRRRRDGTLEIVRPPTRLRRVAVAVAISLAALAGSITLAALLTVSVAVTVALVVAGPLVLAACVVRNRRGRARATIGPIPTGPAHGTARPTPGRASPGAGTPKPMVRTVSPSPIPRATPRPPRPPGSGAVVISIPGTGKTGSK